MAFQNIKIAVKKQFDLMSQHKLFVVNLERNALWEAYLDCFTDPVIKQEHNCNCCKSFIRQYGNIVAIVDNKIVTMWDFEIDGIFIEVPKVLGNLVRKSPIQSEYLCDPAKLVTNFTFNEELFKWTNFYCEIPKELDNLVSCDTVKLGTDFNVTKELVKWSHFYVELPKTKVYRGNLSIDSVIEESSSTKQVFKRSLDEISIDSIETVLELIEQNSLYRGSEFKAMLSTFLAHKKAYDKSTSKDIYAWSNYHIGGKIRNTAIGTLLVDLSNELELDQAVRKFEAMVAPANYKRPTSLVTPRMVEDAKATIQDLGLTESLQRRYAVIDDLPIEQVIFIDRSISKEKDVFDSITTTLVNHKQFTKVEEISLEAFIANVIPTAKSIEVLFESKQTGNLMSLTAAQNKEAPLLFPWSNNIAFSYSGDVADSMKQRVKDAGGQVEGALRFSIQWNTEGTNNIDFDAHAIEPDNHEIMFRNKGQRSRLTGMLDVDIINPKGKVAVENIIWERTPYGVTKLFVHNYSSSISYAGFTAEIEYEGQLYSFSYDKRLSGNEKITVAEILITQEGLEFKYALDNTSKGITKQIWNINTDVFHKVKSILRSPNFLSEEYARGNKHTFFILEDCLNPEPPRGFFNEFLKPELQKHRKVFEVLGNKLRVPESDTQLSGLGFSSTQPAEFIVKVTGSFTRYLKVKV